MTVKTCRSHTRVKMAKQKEDIRKFLKRKCDNSDIIDVEHKIETKQSCSTSVERKSSQTKCESVFCDDDIGHFVNHPEKLNDSVRSRLLESVFESIKTCNYF